jgi:membrane associated rhomboid family serine protease
MTLSIASNKERRSVARRMGLIFSHLYFLSFCGLLTVTLGYDFFHTKNPNGAQGVVFLILGGATLFFVLQLIGAFTDPLPPAHRAPLTDRQKRTLFIVYAFLYVAMMTPPILILVGTSLEFSAERMALLFVRAGRSERVGQLSIRLKSCLIRRA